MHFVPHVDTQVMGGFDTSLLGTFFELSVLHAIGKTHPLAKAVVLVEAGRLQVNQATVIVVDISVNISTENSGPGTLCLPK